MMLSSSLLPSPSSWSGGKKQLTNRGSRERMEGEERIQGRGRERLEKEEGRGGGEGRENFTSNVT